MHEKEHQTCSRNIRKRKDLCKQTGATSINFPDKKRKKRSKRSKRKSRKLAESGEARSFHPYRVLRVLIKHNGARG